MPCNIVTPFVGVWIEIRVTHLFIGMKGVTPFVGVWIEIYTWARIKGEAGVTPFVGVWIEIVILQRNSFRTVCHSLRGSVD